VSIFVGPTITHPTGTTVPTGITGLTWADMVSDANLGDLQSFIANNLAALGLSSANIRTQAAGAGVTYIGITDAQRVTSLGLGATQVSGRGCFAIAFNRPGGNPYGRFDP
jgi:hypothetical protein